MTLRPVSCLTLALLLASAPGCLGTRHGRPDVIGSRNVSSFSRSDRAAATHWRRVLIGAPRPRVRGYVKSLPASTRRGDQRELHFVYDPDFRLVGRVSPTGETHRVDLRGAEHDEGNYHLEHACLLLLGAQVTDEIVLAPMPDPRG